MRVVELWRYPVKSLLGERLDEATVDARGIELDRWWCIRGADGKIASGKTTRRFRRMPNLFTMSSRVEAGVAHIASLGRVDDVRTAARVSEVVGEPVELVTESTVPHHDELPVHIVTTASMRWLQQRLPDAHVDTRRARPNVVLDVDGSDLVEDGWLGRTLRIGDDVVLRVERRATRCVMVSMAQDDLPLEPEIGKELQHANDFFFGVHARVEAGGSIRLGDRASLSL